MHDGFDRHAKRQEVGGYPFLRFFLAFGSSFRSSFRKFFLLCRSYGVHNITVGIDAVFIQFQFLLVELGYLCLLEETGKHTLLQGSRAMHEVGEILEYVHPLVVHGYELRFFFVELRDLHVNVGELVVEHLVRVDLHQLHLMVPPLGILKPIGKVEVEQANGVHGVQVEVPVASTLCLLAYGEGGIVDGAVLEKLLVNVLHLHNKLLALVVLAIHVEDGAAGIHAVAQLLGVKVRHVLHVLFAMKHGVQKADEQLLVKL